MARSLAAVTAAALLATSCATQEPWTPTVDTYGDSRAQYLAQDLEECRYLALRVCAPGGCGCSAAACDDCNKSCIVTELHRGIRVGSHRARKVLDSQTPGAINAPRLAVPDSTGGQQDDGSDHRTIAPH